MTLRECVASLHAMLERAGFDVDAPDVRLAWQVFQEFARLPLDGPQTRATGVGVELCHLADMDEELWLDFHRDIQFVLEDGTPSFATAVGCNFSHDVPGELRAIHKTIGSSGFANLQEFFDFIESQPEFQRCLQLPNWKWEPTRWVWDEDLEECKERSKSRPVQRSKSRPQAAKFMAAVSRSI